ncbi:MAG: YvcK family protein [Candidatus Doudnabacteria bacterium]|nr:YvcK family protein [Candidatus Doudnabacteria bacterium]
MKNIVIVGGGTGAFTLLTGLRNFSTNNTVIVSSADDGGSTGKLRKELGVFPPGDLRQCLVGLSYADGYLKQLFNYRFEKGGLAGHTAGNIILAALEKTTGGVESAVSMAGKLLNVRGQVLPVTLEPTLFTAILNNGKKIIGEHNIDERRSVRNEAFKIKTLQLSPNSPANPKAILALKTADIIVFGPGDLYTSILPNLLVKGIKEAVDVSKAKRVLVTGLMTKPGQTDGFDSAEFVKVVNKYLGNKKLDTVIVNAQKPAKGSLVKYKQAGAEFVRPVKSLSGVKVILADLVSDMVYKKSKFDKLQRSLLRHNSDRLAQIIYEL